MAEQNSNQAVRIADRGYVIVHGKIAFEGSPADELNNNELVRKFYLDCDPHVSGAARRP
jgi:branched-chain amino acid transport system ATP-binding protein